MSISAISVSPPSVKRPEFPVTEARILAETVYSIFAKVICVLIACVSSVFSAKVEHHFTSLAFYHKHRSIAYLHQVPYKRIDASVNITTKVKEWVSAAETELDLLKQIYGEKQVEAWTKVGNSDILLNLDKLKRLDMREEDGVCFGMSLDFIAHYLRDLQLGKSPSEAVKRAAFLQRNGASDTAQIAHIFYRALSYAPSLHQTIAIEKQVEQQEAIEITKWGEVEKEKAKTEGSLNSERINQIDEIVRNRLAEVFRRLSTLEFEAQHLHDRVVVAKMGLQTKEKTYFRLEKAEENNLDSDIQREIDKLSNGVYEIGLCNLEQAEGHSLVFIKEEEGCYLFDPNFGTFAFTRGEVTQALQSLAKEPYLEKGTCYMSFSLMSLV